jgi:DinB superfamily
MSSQTITTHKIRGSVGRRAELLLIASRKALPSWLPLLKDSRKKNGRATVSATDRRSVGVIVHHDASMYPIEIDVARAIASGKTVTDVTWNVVAELNAKHAQEQEGVTKAAALELLRRNSREAAAAVRALTDEELDRAAPFSLSFGAPVTAQFVIEDHALRHSWHHLARIRTALGR